LFRAVVAPSAVAVTAATAAKAIAMLQVRERRARPRFVIRIRVPPDLGSVEAAADATDPAHFDVGSADP
jgi:hypothetical protein